MKELTELKTMKKAELVQFMVDEFGYEESDVKSLTIPKLIKAIQESQAEMAEIERDIKRGSTPKKRQIDRERMITIMNGTMGHVEYTSSKTGETWAFTDYGQTNEMSVGELITIKNQFPRYLRDNWFIMLDDEVVDYLGYSELYKHVLNEKQLEEFFELDVKEMVEIMKKAPLGMAQLIAGMSTRKFESGELKDIYKIKAIQDTLGITIDIDTIQ
ncbi:hypothetical protein CN434_25945 [Bacillus thuringiensis]|uniref:Uncharacterized protein n=2 Tax=Bacillus TaxID=1386 RepID=A0A9X7AS40_BACTU|nr:hypothetical protein CN434_25945 [Bacillus thuringiensis]PFT50734.1 hypothetical protein COK72_01585 [Bacillus thuringiensis]PFY22771.1 hypothetical protein COL44_17905 [Bacillus toyonensis]